jgi:hypothetical protein
MRGEFIQVRCGKEHHYPLVMTDIAVENGPLIVDLPSYKMVIFHSYVSLPEGTRQFPIISMGFQLIQLMCPAGVYSPHAACGLLGCAHRSERHVVFLMLGSWRPNS